MPYKTEINHASGKRRLVYYPTVRRHNIGKKGTTNRRVLGASGPYSHFHATKGVRGGSL